MIKILNGIHETVDYDAYKSLKIYHNKEVEDYPLHWHTALEIIMPIENNYTVMIDDVSHTIREGDIWITPPGVLHQLIAPPSGSRLILLFDYALLCHVPGMDSLLHTLHPYVWLTQEEHPALCQTLCGYLNEIAEEYFHNSDPFTEASISALIIRFFVAFGRTSLDISKRFPGIASGKQHEYIEKFMMVCNYITEHCTEAVNIDELAALAGFSKFHFSRLFKQFTGMSCHDYLLRKRLEHAEQLLLRPDLSITEVAILSGFGSLTTFNRIFRNLKNCTPSEYKRLHRSG